jgi:putative hydrolase of the HAD superfamily
MSPNSSGGQLAASPGPLNNRPTDVPRSDRCQNADPARPAPLALCATTMIFFDLDGTLLDHERAEREGSAAFQRHHAGRFPESSAHFLKRWHDIAEKHMDRFLSGETTQHGQRRERMRELFADPAMADQEADTIFAFYLQKYQESWRLFPDVMDSLKQLQHLPLGIITNGGATQQRKKLQGTRLAGFFSAVVISGDLGVAKPDPGIFLHAAAAAHAQPEACVYIGDRRETDAVAASRAGFRGVWLDRSGVARSEGAIPVLHSLDQLPLFLQTHGESL